MIRTILKNLYKKLEYILISLFILLTIIFTSFYNHKQNKYNRNINNEKVRCLQAKILGNQAIKIKKND